MQVLEKVGRDLDCVISLDLGYKFGEKDNLKNLYEATRKANELSSAESVTYFTAKKLSALLGSPSNVIITTGFRWPPDVMGGETDGPVGAASLARTLHLGYRSNIVFVLEEELLAMMGEVARVAGLPVHPHLLISFPKEKETADREAKRIIQEIKPACVISIERPGANFKGKYHSSKGINISEDIIAKVDILVAEAKRQGILTIGIGDIGNELGLGKIREAIFENVKAGKKCQCPCQGGVAPSVEADIPIIAGVSNWGGHAIAAMLAAIKGNIEIFHNGILEREMIEGCIREKAMDGGTKKPDIGVDSLPAVLHSSVVEVMRTIVNSALRTMAGSLTSR